MGATTTRSSAALGPCFSLGALMRQRGLTIGGALGSSAARTKTITPERGWRSAQVTSSTTLSGNPLRGGGATWVRSVYRVTAEVDGLKPLARVVRIQACKHEGSRVVRGLCPPCGGGIT